MSEGPHDVDAYLAALPPSRGAVAAAVVELVRRRLPDGYEEVISRGMPTWQVPLSTYPTTYNKEPLGYVALAARASGCSLYLMRVATDPELERRLRDGFAAAGKKIDLGRSCLRFKRLEDVDLDALGEVVASSSPQDFVAHHERSRQTPP